MSELAKIFQSERARLIRLVQRIVGCASVAEDIAQDTYLRLDGRNVGAHDVSLVFRTAQNLAIDHVRAQRVRADYAESVCQQYTEAGDNAPESHAMSHVALAGLAQVLRMLPVRTQRIFLLQRLDGWTYPQIAAQLGVSVSTVEKEMIRAMEACRAHLAQQGTSDEGTAAQERSDPDSRTRFAAHAKRRAG